MNKWEWVFAPLKNVNFLLCARFVCTRSGSRAQMATKLLQLLSVDMFPADATQILLTEYFSSSSSSCSSSPSTATATATASSSGAALPEQEDSAARSSAPRAQNDILWFRVLCTLLRLASPCFIADNSEDSRGRRRRVRIGGRRATNDVGEGEREGESDGEGDGKEEEEAVEEGVQEENFCKLYVMLQEVASRISPMQLLEGYGYAFVPPGPTRPDSARPLVRLRRSRSLFPSFTLHFPAPLPFESG